MSGIVEGAVAERLEEDEAGRMRALGAAIVVGFGAALLTYRLLRGGDSDDDGEPDGE